MSEPKARRERHGKHAKRKGDTSGPNFDDGSGNAHKKMRELDENLPMVKDFRSYQALLDHRNDKHERIVKLSRDITIQSKRVIFSLLRKGESVKSLVSEAEEKVKDIVELLKKVCEELKDEDPYQFTRAFSPGVQEFVEAVTLLQYFKDKSLLSYSSAKMYYFQYDGGDQLLLTPEDYMLGVADLSGELMRMSINAMGSQEHGKAFEACEFLRRIYQEFLVFSGTKKELTQKLNVMKNSLKKVENACYHVRVRGSEIPEHMLADLIALSGGVRDHENDE